MITDAASIKSPAAVAATEAVVDRLTPQTRPHERVVGNQRWQSTLFLHWALPPHVLKRHLPRRLSLDTFGGEAFVSFVLFTVVGARLRPLPPLPGLNTFHEVNVRTYVHLGGGEPGIWFLSLDATNAIACALARASLRLPYFFARMKREEDGDDHRFGSHRIGARKRPADLQVTWRSTGPLLEAPAGSLEHFLAQRFYLYSPGAGSKLIRQQVHHAPWPLFSAELQDFRQSLDEAQDLPFLSKRPLAHASPGVSVEFFPPHLV